MVLAAGCSKPSEPAAKPTAEVGADGVRVINIAGNDQMKYDVTQIDAKPGETIRVVMHNAGSLPKAAMAHNFVLLKQGVDPIQFTSAAAAAQATDYFPQDRSGDVIAHTGLTGPKEKSEVTFTVPTEPGDYTYLCTFPGHFIAGMKGVLTVK